jgi:hypothetical protein
VTSGRSVSPATPIGKPRVSPLLSLNTSAVIRYLICVYASHLLPLELLSEIFNEGGIKIISLSNIRPIIIYFYSSQCRLIPYLHQRPIFFKTNSPIVAILQLIRGAQCLIEMIRSSAEEMWRVEIRIRTNIWHLIGRLNQPAADGFLPLRAFKPSSSYSADRGRSIIQVSIWYASTHHISSPEDRITSIKHCAPRISSKMATIDECI